MPVIGSIRRNPEKPTFDLSDYDWLADQWLADRARNVRVRLGRVRSSRTGGTSPTQLRLFDCEGAKV